MDAQAPRLSRRIGMLLVLLGASLSIGAFVRYIGARWNVFAFLVVLWVAAPWFILGATMRLRPLPPAAAIVLACAAGVLVAGWTVFLVMWSPSADALSGIEWLTMPFVGFVVALVLLAVVWSAVRSARNRHGVSVDP